MSRSVADPEYQYIPTKNIYGEKLNQLPPEMQSLAYADNATESHRGHWREQFKSNLATPTTLQELHVEIGCNAGHVVLEWAKQNPTHRYIGIDWKHKQIFRLAEKIYKNKLGNLLAFRANAERLPFMFAPGEITTLSMFFPDPWPKKSQRKNRTASAPWLRSIHPLIQKNGVFHFKTDHREYFDTVIESLETLTDIYTVEDLSYDLHKGHPAPKKLTIPEVTLFERLFIKDGLPIHQVKLRPKKD